MIWLVVAYVVGVLLTAALCGALMDEQDDYSSPPPWGLLSMFWPMIVLCAVLFTPLWAAHQIGQWVRGASHTRHNWYDGGAS